MRPVMGRIHAGEGKIELGRPDLGLRHLHGRLGVAHDRHAVVEGLVGDDLALHQRLAAHDVEIGVLHLGRGGEQLGSRLLQRALEGTRVDHEQQIALLDQLPILEPHLGEVAGDPRPHLHRLDGVEAAGVFVPFHDVALNGLAHRHGRRRVLLLGLRLGRVPLVAPRAQRQERDRGNQRADAAAVTPASEHAHYSSREGDLETNTQQSRAAKAAGRPSPSCRPCDAIRADPA